MYCRTSSSIANSSPWNSTECTMQTRLKQQIRQLEKAVAVPPKLLGKSFQENFEIPPGFFGDGKIRSSGVNKSARERIGRQNLSQKVPSKKGSLGVMFSPRNYRENAHSKSANFEGRHSGGHLLGRPFSLLPRSGPTITSQNRACLRTLFGSQDLTSTPLSFPGKNLWIQEKMCLVNLFVHDALLCCDRGSGSDKMLFLPSLGHFPGMKSAPPGRLARNSGALLDFLSRDSHSPLQGMCLFYLQLRSFCLRFVFFCLTVGEP